MKLVLQALPYIGLLILMSAANAWAGAPQWESVPLLNQEQFSANIKGGEGFQEVHAIAYAPSNASRVYMGTNISGIWRSDDEGRSWQPIMHNFPSFGVRSIAVDPLNQDIVFAAGYLGERYPVAKNFPGREQGLYRSEDGGTTWSKVLEGAFYRQMTTAGVIVVTPAPGDKARSSHVYVAFYDKLFFSAQGGDSGTWKGPVLFPDTKATETTSAGYPELLGIVLSPGTQGGGAKILVTTPEALYSYQRGVVRKIGINLPKTLRSVAVSPQSPSLVLAAADKKGLYISRDHGETFTVLAAPSAVPYSDVAVSPVDANIQYARGHESGKKPIYSRDGGVTWRSAQDTNIDNLIAHEGWWYSAPFAPHPTKPLVALHSSNGRPTILQTEDGGKSWKYSGSGFTGGRMIDMIFLETGEVYMCLVDHGLWRLQANGVTKKLPLDSPLKYNSTDACSGDGDLLTLTIGTWQNRAIATGTRVTPDKINWRYNSKNTAEFRYSFTQKKPYLRVVGNQMQLEPDGNWHTLPYPVFFVSQGDNPVFYALKTSAPNKKPTHIVISHDKGKSWNESVSPLPPKMEKIMHIAVVQEKTAQNPSKIFVGTTNGLWIYQNHVWSLAAHQSGMKKDRYGRTYVTYIAIDPKNNDIIYVARHGRGYGRTAGIFRSVDGGQTWDDFSGNYPTEAVHSIHINPYNGDVYIGGSIGTYRLINH